MTAENADKPAQTATPEPRLRDPAWLLRCLATYALALGGGYGASLLSVPLVLRFYSYLTGARHGSRV